LPLSFLSILQKHSPPTVKNEVLHNKFFMEYHNYSNSTAVRP